MHLPICQELCQLLEAKGLPKLIKLDDGIMSCPFQLDQVSMFRCFLVFKEVPIANGWVVGLMVFFSLCPVVKTHQGLRPRSPSPIASAFGRYPVDAARNPPSFRQCHQRSAPWEGGVVACLGKVGREANKTLWEGLIESMMYNVDDAPCVLASCWSLSWI